MTMSRKCSNTFVREESNTNVSSASPLDVFFSDTTMYVAHTGRTAISKFKCAKEKHLELQIQDINQLKLHETKFPLNTHYMKLILLLASE
jgi:predicted protein tyrosine phosphatase